MIHQLKGSGGLFGFMPITEQAALVEAAIRAGRPLQAIAERVEELVHLMQRVERGRRSDGKDQRSGIGGHR
jgi:HPt (histidine-containing phosphotransfer) domain-containing protein